MEAHRALWRADFPTERVVFGPRGSAMNVGELMDLLAELPDEMPVAIGTTRRGKFGYFHIEHIGVSQRRSWPRQVTSECPECGDRHRHASTDAVSVEPKLVNLGTTIDPIPVREGVDAPEPKIYGRWPKRAALKRAGVIR